LTKLEKKALVEECRNSGMTAKEWCASKDVTRCRCWAHLRRKFEETMPKIGAIESSSAAVGFEYCNRLFAIEAELEKLTADERKIQRQEQSRPVLEAYLAWLETVNPREVQNLAKLLLTL